MDYIYEKIFHEKMSNEVMGFITNVSYVGLGTAVSTIFSFTFNVLGGRVLGPIEYGEFNLIQSIAMFLYIPMLMGYNASMVKYNSEKKEFERQKKIISTTYILIFINTIVTILLYKLFESQILDIFLISRRTFDLSLFFAVLFVLYCISTETLRSLHEMKKYAVLQSTFSIILLSSFVFFMHIGFISFTSMLYSNCIAYGIISLIILFLIRRHLRLIIDKFWISSLRKYSNYAVVGGISSVLYLNIDKILINKYMQLGDVGLYGAYNYSFTTIATTCIIIFTTVFFPYASMHDDKRFLLKKIDKMVIYFIIIGFPITIFGGLIILFIFGKDYVLDIRMVLLFGLAGICIAVDKLYGQTINSFGIKGIKIVSFAAIVMAVINIVLNMFLIPLKGIEGAIIAIIISYGTSVLIMLYKRNKAF